MLLRKETYKRTLATALEMRRVISLATYEWNHGPEDLLEFLL